MATLTEICKRLDSLERSNRMLKSALCVCVCCVLAVLALGATTATPKVLEAEKIILRDGAGNERGELFATDASWGLVLFNKNNTKAASLVVGNPFNALILLDQNGNMRQVFASDMDESSMNLFRPGSDSSQFDVTDNAQGTALTLRDRTNKDRITLGLSPKGAAIGLADTDGATRTMIVDSGFGFSTFSSDGTPDWSPGLDKLSPEEQKRIRELAPKLPR